MNVTIDQYKRRVCELKRQTGASNSAALVSIGLKAEPSFVELGKTISKNKNATKF
jgi:hypothetical protein